MYSWWSHKQWYFFLRQNVCVSNNSSNVYPVLTLNPVLHLNFNFKNSFKSASVGPCNGSKLLKLDVVHASVKSVNFFAETTFTKPWSVLHLILLQASTGQHSQKFRKKLRNCQGAVWRVFFFFFREQCMWVEWSRKTFRSTLKAFHNQSTPAPLRVDRFLVLTPCHM